MPLSAEQIAAINAFSLAGKTPYYCVKLDHPDIEQSIRIVNDNQDLYIGGVRFIAFPFTLLPPEERENQIPRARLRVSNVGRQLLTWIEQSRGGEGAEVEFLEAVVTGTSSDGNRIGEEVWSRGGFSFGQIEINNLNVVAELTTLKAARVPGVKIFNDPAVLPGLF